MGFISPLLYPTVKTVKVWMWDFFASAVDDRYVMPIGNTIPPEVYIFFFYNSNLVNVKRSAKRSITGLPTIAMVEWKYIGLYITHTTYILLYNEKIEMLSPLTAKCVWFSRKIWFILITSDNTDFGGLVEPKLLYSVESSTRPGELSSDPIHY